MRLRAIIADDDKNIRMVLKKALKKIADIDIVGEASNGIEAVELVEKTECDVIFTDIEMPQGDGVTASKQILDIRPKLKIVFITAHQEYMPQAFELYAYDYIVKPFNLARLEQTVKRIQMQLFSETTQNINPPDISDKLSKIYLNTRGKEGKMLVNPNDIYIIQRENRITTIILRDAKLTVNETMAEMEEALPSEIFIRSHKSYIINVNHVKNLSPYGRWTFIVYFDGIPDDALITSDKVKELEDKFNWVI